VSEVANPYAAPAARVDDVALNPEAEAIRRAHINHEASIKAVGFLYYLGGVVLLLAGVATLVDALNGGASLAFAVVLTAMGVAELFAGRGVRGLRGWGRILGCVLAALAMFNFPFGTVIGGYVLYLFLAKKGRTIFSAEYQDVIAATPHVKYRTSMLVWIFLALLIGLFLVAVLLPYFRG
jgi:hypothetical protein